MDSKQTAKNIYQALDEKKGINITIIDISKISIIADYFIIAGGNNENQIKAMADNVEDKLAESKIYPDHIEGYNSANWILMDYNDVIVHIFNEDDRLFYDLERIWRDGQVIESENL